MKISYNWLQEYFDKKLPSPEELGKTLTLKALEVEKIEEKEGDYILDIDVTPNRAHDALSYIGIAKEVAVLFDLPLKVPEVKYGTDKKKSSEYISLEVDDSKLVPRAMKRVVLDVKVGESPNWLKERLISMEQKPINNIVDITNFVMWETGQPVHAFDLDKIVNGEIVIRRASEDEKITTLDNIDYVLKEGMLVIADPEKPLDIAGIKGGASSGIDENTKRIVLSVCSFDQTWIRDTSTALKLKTDASWRFQNGISTDMPEMAMDRLSQLVSEVAEGKVSKEILDNYPLVSKPHKIEVSLEEINRVLGSNIKDSDVKDILDRFAKYAGFKWELGDKYMVEIPHQRLDLKAGSEPFLSGNKEDLIEEIGRVYGYTNIESKLPKDFPFKPKVNKSFYYQELIKDILIENGFSEVITYSFQNEGEVKLANPLSSDKKYLRENLSVGLSKSLEFNSKNSPLLGTEHIKAFEIGKVFMKDKEEMHLGIALSNKEDFVVIVDLLEKKLGKKLEGNISNSVWEINLETIIEKLPGVESYNNLKFDLTQINKFKHISPYPFVLRDIAVWAPKEITSDLVLNEIQKESGELLINTRLFDTYKEENRTSYAFKLAFQSDKKTLSDNEINKVMKGVENSLNNRPDWEVR